MKGLHGMLGFTAAGLLAAGSSSSAGAQTLSESGNTGTLHMLRVSIAQVPGEAVKLQTIPAHKFTCTRPGPRAPTQACETALPEGQVIELRALHGPASVPAVTGTPVSGKQWGGDCQNASGAACTLTMSADRQVTIDPSKAP